MSVINIQLSNDFSIEDSYSDKYTISGHRTFLVQVDDWRDSPSDFLSDSRLPYIGIAWNFNGYVNLWLICTSRAPQRTQEDSLLWTVVCNYEIRNPAQVNANPLEVAPTADWTYTRFEEDLDFDLDQKAVTNSCGQKFNPPTTRDRIRPGLAITQNLQTFDYLNAFTLIDNVNTDTVFQADPYKVKLTNIVPKEEQDQFIGTWWQVVFHFEFNADGWKKELLDCGLCELDGTDIVPIYIDNQPVSEPQLLDGNGNAIPPGPDAASQAQKLEFHVYPEIGFMESLPINWTLLDLGLGAGV